MGWSISKDRTRDIAREYPKILVRERLKKIEISGFSRMTDPANFYEELLETLENSFTLFNRTLILDIRLEYINTSSTKWLLAVFQSLDNLKNSHGMIEVYWYYEEDDETIRETGEIYQSCLKIPFYLCEVL
jgi:hypothetical protein